MSVRRVLIVMVLSVSLGGCARSSDSSLEKRIRRVERGLLGDYGDPPWKRMALADRMAYYQVPGVSIAVINGFQVEWARGYGVLEAGKSNPVTPETLFQPGSVGKVVVAATARHHQPD